MFAAGQVIAQQVHGRIEKLMTGLEVKTRGGESNLSGK